MTFGFKVTGWLEEVRRDRQRLKDRLRSSFVACLGEGLSGVLEKFTLDFADDARLALNKADGDGALSFLSCHWRRQQP
jgi:adenylosuccinate lyase